MQSRQPFRRIACSCGAAAMAMMIAQAAAQVPARNGNIWDGKAHQPDRADTAAAEHAAGVQPSAARRARLDEELEATCHRLMQGDPDRSC